MRKWGWYSIGMAGALIAGALWTPHLFHDSMCLFVRVLPVKAPGPDKLLQCSNIEQSLTLPSDGTVRDENADVQGWQMFTSQDGVGRIRVRFNKSVGSYVFYPRLGGDSDSISIYEVLSDQRRLLYFERGKKKWTPVARRMLFHAECVANGWSDDEFPVELEIVLEGQHAQLWHKNNVVFF